MVVFTSSSETVFEEKWFGSEGMLPQRPKKIRQGNRNRTNEGRTIVYAAAGGDRPNEGRNSMSTTARGVPVDILVGEIDMDALPELPLSISSSWISIKIEIGQMKATTPYPQELLLIFLSRRCLCLEHRQCL